jgi:hypothetical protein
MSLRILLRGCVVLVIAASAGAVSAGVVAELAEPTDFGWTPPSVVLPPVTIGDEGSVELEFKADNVENGGMLWHMADAPGGTVAGGEYRVMLRDGKLMCLLWNTGNYVATWSTPFEDTANWHSVRMAWSNFQTTLVTLDGATSYVSNNNWLTDFTSGEDMHLLSGYPDHFVPLLFDGTMRNVKVYDTYDPSASPVAEHAGPTDFVNDYRPIADLPPVTIGNEGAVELEFKADFLDSEGCIWYMADAFGGTGAGGEYRVLWRDGRLNCILWNAGAYVVTWSTPFDDTENWHSLSMAWKDGESTFINLDGAVVEVVNNGVLIDFTSGEGMDVLGGYPSGGVGTSLFQGTTRNVKIDDAYNAPMPGDANDDGVVDDADASILGRHWLQQEGSIWSDGDFNRDGKVGDADAAILAAHWHETAQGDASVPEPSTATLLLAALATLLARRRR